MTMFPAQNLSKQYRHSGYGGGDSGSYSESFGVMSRLQGYECCSEACSGSDLVVGPMAEDESGSSSKNIQDDRDERWLQLGIGGGGSHENKLDQVDPTTSRVGLIELDLLPSGSSQQVRSSPPEFRVPSATNYGTPLFLQHPGTSSAFTHHQKLNWGFRPIPQNMMVASSSSPLSSTSSLMPPESYFARPFQLHSGVDVAGPSLGFRIIDPPRRPHSGIWFMLQASQNQDGRMTVRLLMKYLVNKLRLDSESEIEITCRGQELLPFLTLQHVRDSIWRSPRDAVTLLADSSSSTTDHVMVLHYARSA
ncbi:hypothetical protein HYC85_006216 [Camellia sinensis]|uniref:Uncharacterized protein n=1 Tax=Camellia sinensis TaxID=4442 RepID=A0A7J7HKD3_CAMSI|nr:hypothetical protein HYC85_006216 [Camellia sinensis]